MGEGFLLGPLVLFAAAMCFTPGPNVVMVTASAANFGFRRTLPQMIGITASFAVMIVAVGLGLAGVLEAEPRVHTALRYAGTAYLLYLAWGIARAQPRDGAAKRAQPIGLVEAALLQWVNPKGWVSALGALATYTTAGGNAVWETAIIAAVLATFCFASVAVWGGFGAAIGRFLRNPRIRIAFNWSMAGLLVISLIPVFW